MKRATILLAVAVLFLCLTTHTVAGGNQKPTAAEVALMEKLLPLVQKGLVIPVNVDPKDEDGLVWVEPLLWKTLTHVEKYRLLQSIGAFYSVHNKLKGTNLKGVMASDITSKEKLGLINLETGKITVKK